MNSNIFFGISLTASFLAGVLALFAPCCITFLFPSYLGTIFKDHKKIMLYTLLFALGLSFILIPVALGFRFFIFFFDSYHKQVYYLGGLFLIFMGIMTLRPIFHLPQLFNFERKMDSQVNAGSAFILGLMSGLTSSCCAPVLFAAVTLTSLAPSFFQALIVSLAYVLGIVFPLFMLSLFYEKTAGKIGGAKRQKIYGTFKWLGGGVFILSGVLIIIFNYLNLIEMKQMDGYNKSIRLLIFEIAKKFQNPLIDIPVFLIIIFIFIKLLKRSVK